MGLERDKNNGLFKWTLIFIKPSLHIRRSLVSLLQEYSLGKGMLALPFQIWCTLNDRFDKVLKIYRCHYNNIFTPWRQHCYVTKHILICTLISLTLLLTLHGRVFSLLIE